MPLFGLFMHYYYKAEHMGLVPKRESNRKWWESIYHYAREFDAVGTATLAVAVVSVLVWRDYDVRERKQVRGRVI